MRRWESGLWSMVALCAALADPRSGLIAVGAALTGAALVTVLLVATRA